MKVLRIINCSDSSMWYRDMDECYVPYCGIESERYYWSIEPVGYKNIVRKDDVELVEVAEVQYYTEKASL